MTVTVAADRQKATYAGRHRFVVELVWKGGSYKLDVSQELVWRQLAKSSDHSLYPVSM